ncbi:54S ribosomal protein L23, mitochondrial [Coelomomyces lativittatus]|nr:54S ribosomal protein L23, mitochondrial [Coelomomyces lativittatus]KAJ1516823.1 54S ribosomal protein L23, mitochondrial [Coelomomyces lativittatus]KAJ1518546.1 54S ribosomal protein L23, mitochondrial [Coelomomyces lativittatus]
MSQGIGNTALAFARVWHEVNVNDLILGRVSSTIAKLLMGKHKPIFHNSVDCGDYVVVTNVKQIRVTGKKFWQKVYRTNSGYPGGIKEITYKDLFEKKPEEIIRKAVYGMLPKTKHRRYQIGRLYIFKDDEHPYKLNIHKNYVNSDLKHIPHISSILSKYQSNDLDSSLKIN